MSRNCATHTWVCFPSWIGKSNFPFDLTIERKCCPICLFVSHHTRWKRLLIIAIGHAHAKCHPVVQSPTRYILQMPFIFMSILFFIFGILTTMSHFLYEYSLDLLRDMHAWRVASMTTDYRIVTFIQLAAVLEWWFSALWFIADKNAPNDITLIYIIMVIWVLIRL